MNFFEGQGQLQVLLRWSCCSWPLLQRSCHRIWQRWMESCCGIHWFWEQSMHALTSSVPWSLKILPANYLRLPNNFKGVMWKNIFLYLNHEDLKCRFMVHHYVYNTRALCLLSYILCVCILHNLLLPFKIAASWQVMTTLASCDMWPVKATSSHVFWPTWRLWRGSDCSGFVHGRIPRTDWGDRWPMDQAGAGFAISPLVSRLSCVL